VQRFRIESTPYSYGLNSIIILFDPIGALVAWLAVVGGRCAHLPFCSLYLY